ncbi:dTDP-glucose 4,6-dehydratase [Desulfocurvibacter africanus]|uniref:dTDP-glucose 4,6-dehydratase n=1 Tax=Desulfocurvibacter africanus subsp. africanus str. Walvis Bay TaxID=690850 RepID=F3YWH5_DESAF|nr:dTDP-glucose 4,6-dehydratase [Desulfocurvibacter africanus]EGJ49361.1 dTDP-glucose 4,6-dehydratase [Desulfocurvibacter africanus subsp. africanus str. Walvis Bay]
MNNCILVTGGAGFIGSCFVLGLRNLRKANVVTLDKLTYAGNLMSLRDVEDDPGHVFVRGDIGDLALLGALLAEHRPKAVINFAAETHVDRSIHDPAAFVRTNVDGTCGMLAAVLAYWRALSQSERHEFRFLHVSTDEVYGALKLGEPAFTESTSYAPNSPYSASKAASDHFVRAYHHSYGLPTLVTNCSNNYGPRQFPEKLIPLMITNALAEKPLPVYGQGRNIRDWLYVADHCEAIEVVLERGIPGQTYNIGGRCEKTNVEIVHALCSVLDDLVPTSRGPYSRLIRFVSDRPGHDFRYAINISKISIELGWQPRETFESGIRKTVEWYLANKPWVEAIQRGEYRSWIETNYASRMRD